MRWTTLVIAVVFVAVVAARRVLGLGDPALVAALGTARAAAVLRREQFTDYYSENPAAVFAGTVWTNNAWIAAQCVLFGITGFWPLMVLVQNAVGVGTAAAIMLAFDRGDVFLLFILPARAARAHLHLRRRGGGSAHLLGLGRAGSAHTR